MSCESEPVIAEYVLWYKKLLKSCNSDIMDSYVMSEVKRKTMLAIQSRLVPNTVHYIALFLNPPFKQLSFLTTDIQDNTLASVKAMLNEIQTDKSSEENECVEIQLSPVKKKPAISHFEEFLDCSNRQESDLTMNIIDVEIQKYKQMQVANNMNILQFWKNAVELPLLQTLSSHILNIPASSATSERVFSVSSRILEGRRTRMLPENLDKVLLKFNYLVFLISIFFLH